VARHHFQSFGQNRVHLRVGQAEVQHGQVGVEVLVVEFSDPVFLHTKLDVFAENLQIGFDDPVMAVGAQPLEDKRVRPHPPTMTRVKKTFGAADGFVHQRDAA